MMDDNNETKTYFTAEIIDLVSFYVRVLFLTSGESYLYFDKMSSNEKIFYC